MKRHCPCGTPLERKPKEPERAFLKRRHCDSKCRYKYHKPKPASQSFGIELRHDKTKGRVGPGMLNYLYGRPV